MEEYLIDISVNRKKNIVKDFIEQKVYEVV